MANQTAANHQPSALYLSYDGMTDPLGRSQVLPYLVGLAASGHQITLISCEKPQRSEAERATVHSICKQAGIDWHPLVYHARPPVLSTLRDIFAIRRLAEHLHRSRHFDLVHCRSYVPSLIGLAMGRRHGIPFIFDIRSFLPDERAESGMWKQSNPLYRAIFRYFKAREEDFLREAGYVVSQTEAGRIELLGRGHSDHRSPISFIPCCVDFAFFPRATPKRRIMARQRLGIDASRRVVVYLGSVGTWYMLDEMLDLFAIQRERDHASFFLIITREDPEPILRAAAERGIPEDAVLVRGALREDVPDLLAAADYAVSFIRPLPSKKGSAPVKLGEYLAVELPLITNGQVGDVDAIIAATGAGVLVEGFDRDSYARALDRLENLSIDKVRLRKGAHHWFDLNDGIARYDAIYRELAATKLNSSTRRGAWEARE